MNKLIKSTQILDTLKCSLLNLLKLFYDFYAFINPLLS